VISTVAIVSSVSAALFFVFQVLAFGITMSIAFNIGRWVTKKTMPWAYNV